MYSQEYRKFKKEVYAKLKNNQLTKRNVMVLEQKIFEDLPQKCARCERKEKLTLDHIVPRELLGQLGIDPNREIVEGNYQILCQACNHFKGGRLDFTLPETKEILLKLVKNL